MRVQTFGLNPNILGFRPLVDLPHPENHLIEISNLRPKIVANFSKVESRISSA